jgi:hypothetical protein
MRKLVSIVLLSALCGTSHSQQPSYEGCSLTAWEVFKATNDYMLGVPLNKAKAAAAVKSNVENIYRIAENEGTKKAYLVGHVNYRRCAGEVAKTKKPLSPIEAAYMECASKSARRTLILVRIDEGQAIEKTKKEMPKELHELIDVLYRNAQEGNLTKAAAQSADSALSCISAVTARP